MFQLTLLTKVENIKFVSNLLEKTIFMLLIVLQNVVTTFFEFPGLFFIDKLITPCSIQIVSVLLTQKVSSSL